jgi:hypothetical protein
MATPYELIISQGFVRFPDGESNIIHAEKAFVGKRAIEWIQKKAPEPDFNLQAYLVALTYYKLDLADLKFEENELLYRYRSLQTESNDDGTTENIDETLGKFYRPDQTISRDGTVTGPPFGEESPQGDEQ